MRAHKLWSSKKGSTAAKLGRDVAREALKRGVAQPCAVFDMDETLMFNRDRYDDDLKITANPHMKELYTWLVSKGVTVFVVTARRRNDWSYNLIHKQLQGLGYHNIKGVYMVPKSYDADPSASRFKLDARRRIIGMGYNILLNIGDQASDHMLMPPYHAGNGDFAARLDRNKYYGIKSDDGTSLMSIKLKNTYVVS